MLFPLLVVAALQLAPTQIVKQFFDAYQRLDIDGMTALMSPDMVFDDPTFRLHANNRADWRKQMEPNRQVITSIAADIHAMVPAGDTVAVEYTLSGGIKRKDGVRNFKVRCASFFRIASSLIKSWTDYCDYRTFAEQTSPAPPAPAPAMPPGVAARTRPTRTIGAYFFSRFANPRTSTLVTLFVPHVPGVESADAHPFRRRRAAVLNRASHSRVAAS